MNSHYLIRRLIIIVGYIIFFSIVGFLIYYLITPKATCFDGKKNQSEAGIDCGGVCSPCKVDNVGKDLVITEKTFVSGGGNTYDAVIKITNPNDAIGAASFHYLINLRDASGIVLSTKEGDDYILPADSKYIVQIGLNTLNNLVPTQIDFEVSDVKWIQKINIQKPQLNVYNKRFGPDGNGLGSRVEGVVRNESVSDFKRITVIVILRDEDNNVLGVSNTQEDNMRAQQEGGFVLTWPYTFPKAVRSMEVDVQTDVYDAQNLLTKI